MASVAHPHVSTDEFDALQENAGWTLDVELIRGEGVLMPPVGPDASSARGELFVALRHWQDHTADRRGLLLQDVFVALPDGSRLAPDIAWWSVDPPRSRGAVCGVPDLVVGVLSPSTRANNLGVKREVYFACGVREQWLVDPDAHHLIRALPDDGADERLAAGDTLRSDLLAGFALEVARIFAYG